MSSIEEITLGTCSYNTPDITIAMLQSFVAINGKGYKLLICENSTNDETEKLLNSNKIDYIKNFGGTHSRSVDILLDNCKTKYLLLVDTDIIFLKPIDIIYNIIKKYDATLLGKVGSNRGGYNLRPRVNPWYCLINVDNVKEHNIKFHDQKRIDESNSNGFYGNIPIQKTKDGIFYDCGSTFYEDIIQHGLKIINLNEINTLIKHAEGISWHRFSGHPGFIRFGNYVYSLFSNEIKKYTNINIKGCFVQK